MKVDGKHLIGNVQTDTVAYRAGVREDDILLEVNNERVDGLDRDQVVARILKHSKHVDLLVLSSLNNESGEADAAGAASLSNAPPTAVPAETKLRAQSMRDVAPSSNPSQYASRIVQLNRAQGQSYGFSISKSHSGPPYISEIDPDSPASSNGELKEGDLILKLNGIDLTDKSHSKILEIAKKQTDKGTKIELEIADPPSLAASDLDRRARTYSEATQEDVEGNFERL